MKNNIFNLLIFIFIAAIPMVQWNAAIDATMLSRQIWFTVFVITCSIALLLAKKNEVVFTPIHWFMLIITALCGFSVLYAFNYAEAIYTFNKFLLYTSIFMVLLAMLQNNLIDLKTISKGVLLFVIVACGYQIFELYTKGNLRLLEGKKLYEINSLFGHKNLFSSIIFLCFPFLIYLIIKENKWIKIISITISIIALALLVFIQTKAVLLAIIIGGGMSILVLFNSLKINKNIKISSIVSLLFMLVLLGYLGKNKLTLLSNNDTVQERILLWTNTWQMIKENPVAGVGGGNWQVFFPKYGLQNFMQTNYLISDGYTTFQRPHNDFLWTWSELGILALLAYISVFIIAFIYAIKNIQQETDTNNKIINAGFLMTIIGYVFISLVDFPLERSEHQFFILLIIAMVCKQFFTKNKTPKSVPSKWILLSIIVVNLFNLFVFVKRTQAETHAHQMLLAHNKNNWNLMIKEAKKANNEYFTIDNFSIPLTWYAGVAYSALGDNNNAKLEFENAYEINPYQIHVLNNIASINEMEGKHDLAIKYYNEALAISPSQPDALLNKSAALFNMGKIDEAFLGILKFKYDESNTQFKTYYLAIAKAKFEKEIEISKATNLPIKLSDLKNDTILLNKFDSLKSFYIHLP
ncbi:MAG: O-antigen ligase family protein [Bacteroidia bacterium]